MGLGLITSIARPDGNRTGINFFSAELVSKRIELLGSSARGARVAVLVNPTGPDRRYHIARPGTGGACDGTANPGSQCHHQPRNRCTFLLCRRAGPMPSSSAQMRRFNKTTIQLANWQRGTGSPLHMGPRLPRSGRTDGLRSEPADSHRQLGVYVARILNGAKPADLPVVQATKFELVINAQPRRSAHGTAHSCSPSPTR